MLFLLIVLLLALTAGAIWALHRNQLRRQVEVVERIRELPPLESTTLPDFTGQPAAHAASTISELPSPPMESGISPASQKVTPAPAAVEGVVWQDQVKLLKDKGDLDAAVVLCQQQFPKAQAFQQAAVLLRLQMRQQLDNQQPLQTLAGKLYRCAVLADLFRSGAQLKPANPRQALQQLAKIELQYQQIGHQQLKLLTKSDVKLLEQLWGPPPQHIHAENALGSIWMDTCRR